MRSKLKLIAPFMVLLMLLAGCATLTRDSYRTLAGAKITYEAIMSAAHDAWKAEYITDEQVIPLIDYGSAFWAAYQTAASALETYAANEHNDPAGQSYLNSAMRVAMTAFSELLTHWDMLQPIIDHAKNRGTT